MKRDQGIPVPPTTPNDSTTRPNATSTIESSASIEPMGYEEIPPAPRPKRLLRPFDAKQWAIVAFAILEAVLWMFVFYPEDVFDFGMTPGLGMALFAPAALAIPLAFLGKQGRYDRTTIPLIIATVLLSLIPFLFGNELLRALNAFILLGSGTLTLFLVADIRQDARLSMSALAHSIVHLFTSMFSSWTLPFKALRARMQRGGDAKARPSRGIGAGVAIALVLLLLVILPLLSSADVVFGSLLTRPLDWFSSLSLYELFERVLAVVFAGPFLFGLLWGTLIPAARKQAADRQPDASSFKAGSALPVGTVLVVLVAVDIVYLVFVGIQFVYLFGGKETALMFGGYAAYARSGFFQLVFVAGINLVIGLIATQAVAAHDNSVARSMLVSLRVLIALLCASTAVILASALMRMLLYIDAYGLSLLRTLTLLGMTFIAVMLIALVVKMAWHKLNYFAVFTAAGLALWIGFNYTSPDARIAEYNVDRYIADELEEADVSYLADNLSSDAVPALEKLKAHLEQQEQDDKAKNDQGTSDGLTDEYQMSPAEELQYALNSYDYHSYTDEPLPWQLWWRGTIAPPAISS